ncbi:MAG: HIT family protein [Patescibacteria group bacterium]
MSSSRTVFEQVWDGALPSFPVFRSDHYGLMALLDIYSTQPGHLLVIPKEPVDHVHELEPYRYLQLFAAGQVASRRLDEVLKPTRVMHIVFGYDIPHVHLHLFPSFRQGETEDFLASGLEAEQVQVPETDLLAMQARLAFPPELTDALERRLEQLAVYDRFLNASAANPRQTSNILGPTWFPGIR